MSCGNYCGNLLPKWKKSKNMFVQSIIYLKTEQKIRKSLFPVHFFLLFLQWRVTDDTCFLDAFLCVRAGKQHIYKKGL